MDKLTFYETLTQKLLQLGVPQTYIDRHLKQFDQYFSAKNDEEIAAEIARLGDLDRAAARLKRMTDQIILEEQQAAAEPSENAAPSEPVSDTAPTPTQTPSEETEPSATASEGASAEEETKADSDPLGYGESPKGNDEELDEIFPDDDDMSFLPAEPHTAKMTAKDSENLLSSVYMDPAALKKKRRKFWLIFALTSPIWLVALAATAAFFALTYFLMAVVIIASVAVLVAITAGGTVVSLLGLIFGVIEMISCLPVGLYECGLAVMIGALTMFVSILVYNFAVRLIPFAGRWLLVFVKYVFRKYKELFVYLKKECIGL